jgi:hypothetical protein
LAPDKKIIPGLSESEVHWYFYVPKRVRERGDREREREYKSAGDFIS